MKSNKNTTGNLPLICAESERKKCEIMDADNSKSLADSFVEMMKEKLSALDAPSADIHKTLQVNLGAEFIGYYFSFEALHCKKRQFRKPHLAHKEPHMAHKEPHTARCEPHVARQFRKPQEAPPGSQRATHGSQRATHGSQ